MKAGCWRCGKTPRPGHRSCEPCAEFARDRSRELRRQRKGYTDECDCGAPAARMGICERCAFLDGTSTSQQSVIAFIREAGRMVSTAEVARGLGIKHNTAAVMLARLKRKGRLRRYELVGDRCIVACYELDCPPELLRRSA